MLKWWLLLLLMLLQHQKNFPPHLTAAASGSAVSCPPHCRNEYQEDNRSGLDGGSSTMGNNNNNNTRLSLEKLQYLNRDNPGGQTIARAFRGHGCAAHLFVEFGAYRGGNQTFTILGLASKPLHTYGHPSFSCEWIPPTTAAGDSSSNTAPQGTVTKDYPDYGYGRAYTVVVVTCTFNADVGTDGKGGELVLHAYHGDAMGREERIVALAERAGEYNASAFDPPYAYDFVYCGSPLFGRLNVRRVREWIAYHDMVFGGERSHFVLYDAGGVHEAVREALRPWMELGRVSVEDIRATELFDGYYYNQFLMVNDCLQRSKFLANWTIFFDLDEFLYVAPPHSLRSLLLGEGGRSGGEPAVTEFSFTQYRMVKDLCHSGAVGPADSTKQWAFEKLTYRDLSSSNRDVKYVCNPRAVLATGVHGVEHFKRGRQERWNDTVIRYYHYHGSIDMIEDDDLCKELSEEGMSGAAHNFTRLYERGGEGGVVQYDGAMVPFALMAKKHEVEVLQQHLEKHPSGLTEE